MASVRALQSKHMNCEPAGLVRESDKFRSPRQYGSTWVLPHSFVHLLANGKQWCWVVFKTMIFEAALCSCFLPLTHSTKTPEVSKTYNGQGAPENLSITRPQRLAKFINCQGEEILFSPAACKSCNMLLGCSFHKLQGQLWWAFQWCNTCL